MRFNKTVSMFVLLCVLLTNSAFAAELVVNGDFETGDFAGWTKVSNGEGDFFVYSGTTTPVNGYTVLPPPQGTYAAIAVQGESADSIIYQDIAIPSGSGAVDFSATVYLENRALDYSIASDLSYLNAPNQQMRVDIMDPVASLHSTSTGVYENLFRTNPGDLLSMGYTQILADLSAYQGQIVRLRIAVVASHNHLYGAIDNVSINATSAASIPTLSEWGMIIMSLILAGSAIWMMRRRQVS